MGPPTPVLSAKDPAQRRKSKSVRRAQVRTATFATVNNSFRVTSDVAPLCSDPGLLKFVSTCVNAPTEEGTRTRLVFELGARAGDGSFSTQLHQQFAVNVLRHMDACPGWRCQTKQYVDRFDFNLVSGAKVQTLYKPHAPFVSTKCTVNDTVQATTVSLNQPNPYDPTHVRIRHMKETHTKLAANSMRYHSVCVCRCNAYATRAWTYRLTQQWEGATLEDAYQAMAISAPRVSLVLELDLAAYDSVNDHPFLIGSALQRLLSMLNYTLLAESAVSFNRTVG